MNPYLEIFKVLPFPCLLLERIQEGFVIRDANAKYCQLSEKKAEEVRGHFYPHLSFTEHIPEQNLQLRRSSLEQAWKTGIPNKKEFLRFDLASSEKGENLVRFWKVENIPIKDDQGKVVKILNMAKDPISEVLEKPRIEQKLAGSREQQDHFIRKSHDGLYTLDNQGNFVSLNEGLVKLTEVSEEQLINRSFMPFCSPQDRERILECFNRALQGENQVFEASFISAKAKELILEISLIPIMREGNIPGVYGIAKDRTSLRKKEEELFRNQKKFQALVQEGSEMVVILGRDGIYHFVSDTVENVLGVSPAYFMGKNVFEFIHPEDMERVIREFSALESEKHVRIEAFRFQDPKGDWRWMESHATNFLEDPYVEGIVVNSREITELVEQSQQIKQLYERYALAAEATEDLIYDWNLETDEVIRFHKSNENFFGYRPQEIHERDFWKSHVHPEELPGLRQLLEDSLGDREQPTLKTQYRFRKSDGTYAQIIDRANIVRDENGKAIRLIGVTSDVSQLMYNKNALKLANKRFSYAMKATKEMIWDWNIEQGHIKRSGAYKKIFGYNNSKNPSEETLWFDKISESDRTRVRESLEAALKNPEARKWREEYCVLRKSGERAFVIDRGYILRNKQGTAIRMVGAVLDVSESRRMLREIQKQNEVLKEVAWEQAHIVRAPLARLKGLLDLLEQEEYEEWSREELVGLIRTSAEEMDNIIGNIIRKTEKNWNI